MVGRSDKSWNPYLPDLSVSDELLDTLASWNSVLKSIEPRDSDGDQP